MFVGATGVGRVVERTVQLMKEHDTDDVRPFGGIDVATLQRYLNFHCSVSLDLFGAETSTNAANYFAAGLKGRFHEERRDDDHRLHGLTTTVPHATDDGIGEREAPALTALNETLRDDFVADCRKGVDRWNRTLAEVGEELELPHVGFNRNVGTFAGRRVSPDGQLVTEDEWAARRRVVAADGRRPGVRRVADGRRDRARQDGRLGGAAVDGDPRQAGRLRVREGLIGGAACATDVQRLRRPARPQRRRRPRRSPGGRHPPAHRHLRRVARRGRRHGGRAAPARRRPGAARGDGDARLDRVLRRLPRRPAHRRRPGTGQSAASRSRHRRRSSPPAGPACSWCRRSGPASSTPSAPPRPRCRPSSSPARRSGTTSSAAGRTAASPWATWDESPGFWLCTSGSTGPAEAGDAPPHRPARHRRHLRRRRCSASARTTAATRSVRCSTPTGWATRCRSRSRSAPRPSSNRRDRRRRRSSARSPGRCSRRCCSASRRSTPRCVRRTCRPTRSRPCAGECRRPSRCRRTPSTASRSASACASSTASGRRR